MRSDEDLKGNRKIVAGAIDESWKEDEKCARWDRGWEWEPDESTGVTKSGNWVVVHQNRKQFCTVGIITPIESALSHLQSDYHKTKRYSRQKLELTSR